MVAKCLDDNKPKIRLKSKFALFQTSSNLFNFIQFVECWRNFLEKETVCVAFTYSVKRAREIRKFQAALVVQRWLKNVQKKRDTRAKLFFY